MKFIKCWVLDSDSHVSVYWPFLSAMTTHLGNIILQEKLLSSQGVILESENKKTSTCCPDIKL